MTVYIPDRDEERGLLVGVMMEAELGEDAAVTPADTRAVADGPEWRDPELSSRAMASLFSLERRFWNHTWITLMSSPVLLIRSSLICFDGFCSRLYACTGERQHMEISPRNEQGKNSELELSVEDELIFVKGGDIFSQNM